MVEVLGVALLPAVAAHLQQQPLAAEDHGGGGRALQRLQLLLCNRELQLVTLPLPLLTLCDMSHWSHRIHQVTLADCNSLHTAVYLLLVAERMSYIYYFGKIVFCKNATIV